VYARLHKEENARFTLPSEAVAKKIHHALTASNPKIRYWITVPTIVMGILTRLLPERLLDKLIKNQSN